MDVEQSKRPKGRKLKWAFGISLAINLVFIGFFAGAVLRHAGEDRADKRGPPGIQNYGAPFVRALPRDAKRALHKALRAQGPGQLSRAERRALYQEMAVLLRADPFDPDAVEKIFETQKKAAQGLQLRAQTEWLSLVAAMSPEERIVVADRLQEVLSRKRSKDKRRP